MKKRFIIFGIIVMVLIAIFIIWLLIPTPAPESIKNMVLENEPDYTLTALIYYKDFQQQDEDLLAYSPVLQPIEGIYEINCYSEMFDIRIIELSEAEGASAMVVRDSRLLDNHPLTRVIVYDGFVSFCNEGGRESLVYSVDGTRPSYLHDPSEDFDRIGVHKITDNWYYVRGEKFYYNGRRIRRN